MAREPFDKAGSQPKVAAVRRLVEEAVPLAVQRHAAVLGNPKTTGQVLNRAIEIAVKYGACKHDLAKRDLNEMSAAALADAIDCLEKAAKSLQAGGVGEASKGSCGVFG